MNERYAVTGSFGFTGRAITVQLIGAGNSVVTLTRRPELPNPFGDALRVAALDYARPALIARDLAGVDTLFNTAWLRFERGDATFAAATERTGILVSAAATAGVRRVVHVSVAGATLDSPVRYWAAKARAERAVSESGLEWAILRPTILFGDGDILFNNLAWFLRRAPLFALPVRPDCLVQPVHVEDVAALALDLAAGESGRIIDAAGPERMTFRDMVRTIREAVDSRARLLRVPTNLALAASSLAGLALGDVVLTRDECRAIELGLLASSGPASGRTEFSTWAREAGSTLGREYHSELARNFSR